MKILHVLSYWGGEYGGPFINTGNICYFLMRHGHSASVITTSKYSQDRGAGFFPWEVDGQILDIPIRTCQRIEERFFLSPEFARTFKAMAEKSDAVIIHGMWRFPVFYAAAYCQAKGIPYFCVSHGMLTPWSLSQSKWAKAFYLSLFGKRNLRSAAAVFYLSSKETEFLSKFNKNCFCFVNSVNLKELMPVWQQRFAEGVKRDGETTLLYLSRIHPKKGLLVLLHAFRDILREYPGAKLIVAGPVEDAGYFGKVTDFVKDNGLEAKVVFQGALYDERKRDFFLKGDIFILPTEDDSMPGVILEAMGCGLPVVTTTGANMPFINDKMGFVAERDPQSLRKALVRLIGDPVLARAFGVAGHEYVVAHHDLEKNAETFIGLLQKQLTKAS